MMTTMKTSCRIGQVHLLPLLFLFGLCAASLAATQLSGQWVGSWAASPDEAEANTVTAGDATYREIVHTSVGGSAARIVLTNELSVEPLTVGAASIAISTGHGMIDLSTVKTVTFGGHASVTLPAGVMMLSDPVDLKLPPLADVAVSLFVPAQATSQTTVHSYALQTNYIAPGNVVGDKELDHPKETSSWAILKGIEVKVNGNSGAVVTLGDSITDGAASSINSNGRWPDVLARRLQVNRRLTGIGTLNAGINGNRLLHDGDGGSALGRLDRDVLTQAGVKYLIVLEGTNDIGHLISATSSDPAETTESILQALGQIVERAHTHAIRVIGATILPYAGSKYSTAEGEKMRQAINTWIRTDKDLDGVADFDKIIRDPAHPTSLLPAYDSGDHLHPNSAGLTAMGNGIDLKLFQQP